MNTAFAIAAAALYAMAAIVLLGKFVHQEGPNKRLGLGIASLGVVAHIAFLLNVIMVAPGQDMSITNVLSLVAWIITTAMLIFARAIPNLILLPVVFGFASLSVLASLFIPVSYIMHIELQPGLVVHISLSLFAYCTLVIAFLYALQMSYITYRLKQKGAALLHSSLPPLMLVEGILFKLLLVGTCLLSVSLLSGFVFLDDMFNKTYAHKTVLSSAALVVYLILLVGQKLRGWRGRQVIFMTVLGVILLSLAYFGSKLVREILL
ncbi:Chromosome partitioning protein ParB [Alteromonas sp. 38]|uniref:cytochrome C assembly family protein n=1 Tax=Alteromonas TaxID=226 RepID=UPI0012F2990C|nr:MULTISPECIES: cytochrome c biogenesis protein CcsA [Alteromonas]CAD5283615.1 Chromosome partitioning protein ParB [Alteromonas sp. 154]VXB46695.1 Chromosome partitioning protein ParB [Alteromonas sp. 38]